MGVQEGKEYKYCVAMKHEWRGGVGCALQDTQFAWVVGEVLMLWRLASEEGLGRGRLPASWVASVLHGRRGQRRKRRRVGLLLLLVVLVRLVVRLPLQLLLAQERMELRHGRGLR